jgi:hypothetical protein
MGANNLLFTAATFFAMAIHLGPLWSAHQSPASVISVS